MAFPGEHYALAGFREKFRDRLRDTSACLIHERFDLYSPRESGFFGSSHLRRSQNRQVQIRPPDLVLWSVLLSRLISLSSSFDARFSCVTAWTCGVEMTLLSFGPCTVAAGSFRSSPLVSLTW